MCKFKVDSLLHAIYVHELPNFDAYIKDKIFSVI